MFLGVYVSWRVSVLVNVHFVICMLVLDIYCQQFLGDICQEDICIGIGYTCNVVLQHKVLAT